MNKRIDQISNEITSADQLNGAELFLVSSPSASAAKGFVSKKMTLTTLKSYFQSGGSSSIIVGEPVIFDTPPGHPDYVWKHVVEYPENSASANKYYEKTVTQNCLVVIYCTNTGYNTNTIVNPSGRAYWHNYEEFRVNGKLINFHTFRGHTQLSYMYVKAGSTISFKTYTGSYAANVSVFPLLSGGVFIDTTKMVAPYLDGDGEWIYNACNLEANSTSTISVDFDAMVNIELYNDPQNNVQRWHTINDMKVMIPSRSLTGVYF